MEREYGRIKKCHAYCRSVTAFKPKAAIVLGSGLGEFATEVAVEAVISYRDIKGFPVSTVPGHEGRFIFAHIEDIPVVMMQGRVHYYEGYSMEDVVLPIRLMHMLGAETLLLTNAAGGINPSFGAGDFMLIKDQISSFVPSPLVGQNIEELGTRFPDMSNIYDETWMSAVREAAKMEHIRLKEGVYLQFTGPNFESPAEVRMAGMLGADAVGMSTACEAIAARHMGMKVCGISCIVNMAAGIQKTPLNHQEVQDMAKKKSGEFSRLLKRTVSFAGQL